MASWFGLGSSTSTDTANANNNNDELGTEPSSSSGNNNNRQSAARSLSPDPPETASSLNIANHGDSPLSSSITDYRSMMLDQEEDDPNSQRSSRRKNKARPIPPSSTRTSRRNNNRNLQSSSPAESTLALPLTSTPTVNNNNNNNTTTHTIHNSAPTINYRGFSTSIGDMFTNPHHERVDCCAMTCCGIFQSDRDRYLLQGVTPPSPWKRVWVHAALPLILFFMAGYVALHVYNVVWNEFLCLVFLLLLLGSVLIQCQKGRIKRMEIRKDVLWYKYQLIQHQHDHPNEEEDDDDDNNNDDDNDENDNDDNNNQRQQRRLRRRRSQRGRWSLDQILDTPREEEATYYYRGQTERDVGCSHPCCFLIGCYPTDKPGPAALLAAASGDANELEESLCSCLFKTFCSPCCGMHLQCFGICGMAQESREVEAVLLPPAYRRLDYVTMEPMMTFYTDIYNQRWLQFNTFHTSGPEGPRAMGPFDQWKWPQLSRLSKLILQGWIALTVFLCIWSIVGPLFWTQFLKGHGRRHFFSIWDFFVYIASWIVSFGTLAIVVYLCQRHKPLELSIDAMIKYFASGFILSSTLAIFYELVVGLTIRLTMLVFMTFFGIDVVEDNNYNMWVQQPLTMGFARGYTVAGTTAAAADGEDYLPVFGRDHPFMYSVYLFVNAFVIAAMTEEICKYFGFRMMEHPDFLSRRDLEDASRAGIVYDGEDGSEDNSGRHNLSAQRRSAGPGQDDTPQAQQPPRRLDFPHHRQSHQAHGSAITVAMVCVALGFSLCEDLIYIFLYNGSSVPIEIYVLVARTLFPIHPIASALQSIGVCERDVEKCPIRFGRVLLPAIIFHGTYDFLLLWIDFLASLKRQDGYHDNDDEALEVGVHAVIASYAVSATIMGAGLFWFYKKSQKQRERLAALDDEPPEQSA